MLTLFATAYLLIGTVWVVSTRVRHQAEIDHLADSGEVNPTVASVVILAWKVIIWPSTLKPPTA